MTHRCVAEYQGTARCIPIRRRLLRSGYEPGALRVSSRRSGFPEPALGQEQAMDTRTMAFIALVIAVIVAVAVFTTVI